MLLEQYNHLSVVIYKMLENASVHTNNYFRETTSVKVNDLNK